jgi:hypothetical protein
MIFIKILYMLLKWFNHVSNCTPISVHVKKMLNAEVKKKNFSEREPKLSSIGKCGY